jgi:hypothetical protein
MPGLFSFLPVGNQREYRVGNPSMRDKEKRLSASGAGVELRVTSGKIISAIRACGGKIDPVNGLRWLSSGIGKFAIRACRPKIEPV